MSGCSVVDVGHSVEGRLCQKRRKVLVVQDRAVASPFVWYLNALLYVAVFAALPIQRRV